LKNLVLNILILLCGVVLAAFAQQSPEGSNVKLYRYGDLLREHHIELTGPALVRALKNPDASVRYLAAMKLAEDKTVDAVPAIEDALATEGVPRDRVNIALALALLGDQTGLAELKKACADSNFNPEFRLYAATYMFDLHSQTEECLRAAEEIVTSKNATFGDRISALSLLPQFRNLSAEESKKLFQLVVDRLVDPEPTVQMAASAALASLGNQAAVPILRSAIEREKDEGIREVFKKDLGKLQGHP
jgi:HEAT repeat protein